MEILAQKGIESWKVYEIDLNEGKYLHYLHTKKITRFRRGSSCYRDVDIGNRGSYTLNRSKAIKCRIQWIEIIDFQYKWTVCPVSAVGKP